MTKEDADVVTVRVLVKMKKIAKDVSWQSNVPKKNKIFVESDNSWIIFRYEIYRKIKIRGGVSY